MLHRSNLIFMNDRKFNFRKIFNVRNLTSLIICVILSSIVFVLVYWSDNWALMGAVNGSFAAGCIGVGFACLSFATNKGIFDVFSLGFQNTISVMRKEGTKKYPGLFEYREMKKKKRSENEYTYLAYLFSGIIYLIVSLSLYFPMMASISG